MQRFKITYIAMLLTVANATTGAPAARAAFVYSYAQQTLSNFRFTGTGLVPTAPSASVLFTNADANKVDTYINDLTDPMAAYQGASPSSPENNFAKYSALGVGNNPASFPVAMPCRIHWGICSRRG